MSGGNFDLALRAVGALIELGRQGAARTDAVKPSTRKTIPIYQGRRFPVGIANASKRLGVSMSHLYRVLTGERPSAKTSAGYAALVAELKGGRP